MIGNLKVQVQKSKNANSKSISFRCAPYDHKCGISFTRSEYKECALKVSKFRKQTKPKNERNYFLISALRI